MNSRAKLEQMIAQLMLQDGRMMFADVIKKIFPKPATFYRFVARTAGDEGKYVLAVQCALLGEDEEVFQDLFRHLLDEDRYEALKFAQENHHTICKLGNGAAALLFDAMMAASRWRDAVRFVCGCTNPSILSSLLSDLLDAAEAQPEDVLECISQLSKINSTLSRAVTSRIKTYVNAQWQKDYTKLHDCLELLTLLGVDKQRWMNLELRRAQSACDMKRMIYLLGALQDREVILSFCRKVFRKDGDLNEKSSLVIYFDRLVGSLAKDDVDKMVELALQANCGRQENIWILDKLPLHRRHAVCRQLVEKLLASPQSDLETLFRIMGCFQFELTNREKRRIMKLLFDKKEYRWFGTYVQQGFPASRAQLEAVGNALSSDPATYYLAVCCLSAAL